MRINFFAATLAFLNILIVPQPALADWRDTLVRAIATPLINRGVNYLFSSESKQPERQTPVKRTQSQRQRKAEYIPPPPVLDKLTAPVKPTGKKGTLEIPPPPKVMVPPPPPGVPTGTILGLYPDELNNLPTVKPTSNAPKVKAPPPVIEIEAEEIPKVAPDFRKARKVSGAARS